MARLFQMLLLCLSLIWVWGCSEAPQGVETEGIKIGELSPAGRRIQPQLLQTTNIDVYTFELPAGDVKRLDEVWAMLVAGTLRYSDPNGFSANGLRAGTGKFADLDAVKNMLKAAGAEKLSTTALLIPNGQSEMINVGRLTRKTTISYIHRGGDIKSAEVGPAICGLRVTATRLADPVTMPGTGRAVPQIPASIQVVPAILVSTEGLPEALAEQLRAKDLRIYSAGFSVMLKPGEFVMVAPREYKPDEITAAGRFFTIPGFKPAVTVLLLVCTSIT